jgi:hypothetical protein
MTLSSNLEITYGHLGVIFSHYNNVYNYAVYIVTCYYRGVYGLVIGFIDHLYTTTRNYKHLQLYV